jgi:hypothetical protein
MGVSINQRTIDELAMVALPNNSFQHWKRQEMMEENKNSGLTITVSSEGWCLVYGSKRFWNQTIMALFFWRFYHVCDSKIAVQYSF